MHKFQQVYTRYFYILRQYTPRNNLSHACLLPLYRICSVCTPCWTRILENESERTLSSVEKEVREALNWYFRMISRGRVSALPSPAQLLVNTVWISWGDIFNSFPMLTKLTNPVEVTDMSSFKHSKWCQFIRWFLYLKHKDYLLHDNQTFKRNNLAYAQCTFLVKLLGASRAASAGWVWCGRSVGQLQHSSLCVPLLNSLLRK